VERAAAAVEALRWRVHRTPVDSTSVKSVGYDPDTGTLQVEFVHGGVYEYLGVPEKVHRELLEAESIGAYFTQYVRDRYFTRKLD
jgi:KTSC domain